MQTKIYSVSELTREIKQILEETFPFIWLTGEISNLRTPSSGHSYFTLKDNAAQISAVVFRGQQRNLRFQLENGLKIVGLGRISLYEPRGTYQMIFEHIEPEGLGALQLAFEQLKTRLQEEGLFDESHKQPLPFLPGEIAVVTSPTGSVVHDIINVLARRFPNTHIRIMPVKVQGDHSERQIVDAIEALNDHGTSDVMILARGGGSLEDLQAFNTESVARAIFASQIPVVSAIGHETDYTIADFAADLRAPTPSAAAELVVPVQRDLAIHLLQVRSTLSAVLQRKIDFSHNKVHELFRRLIHPRKKLQEHMIRLDDLASRQTGAFDRLFRRKNESLQWNLDRFLRASPQKNTIEAKVQLDILKYKLLQNISIYTEINRHRIREQTSRLQMMDPRAVLSRGYSITRSMRNGRVVRDEKTVDVGEQLEVTLEKGALFCRLEGKTSDGSKKAKNL